MMCHQIYQMQKQSNLKTLLKLQEDDWLETKLEIQMPQQKVHPLFMTCLDLLVQDEQIKLVSIQVSSFIFGQS
jgi:hypothetical protein